MTAAKWWKSVAATILGYAFIGYRAALIRTLELAEKVRRV